MLLLKTRNVCGNFFKEAANLGLEVGDLDCLIKKRTKALAMTHFHDDADFLNDFLEKCPSGRYRTMKYRSALGKDSFVRHLIHTLNDTLGVIPPNSVLKILPNKVLIPHILSQDPQK